MRTINLLQTGIMQICPCALSRRGATDRWRINFIPCCLYLWVLSAELDSCHPSRRLEFWGGYEIFKIIFHLCRRAYEGVEVKLHSFLNLALDSAESSAPRPKLLYTMGPIKCEACWVPELIQTLWGGDEYFELAGIERLLRLTPSVVRSPHAS
jgi:hypothetical protein